MTRYIPIAIALAALALSLLIISDTRLVARADLPTDDGLFLRPAADLRAGNWLGSFDDVTLSKGPGYPIVIAVADALSVPLKVAEQLLYLLSAGLMAWLVSRISRRRLLGASLFVVLALDPTWFLDGHVRVLRETVYAAASFIVVGGTAWLFLVRTEDRSPIRPRDVAAAILVGLAMAFFWLVREEGIWLAPTVAFLALAGLLRAVLARRTMDVTDTPSGQATGSEVTRSRTLARLVLSVLVAGFSISIALGAVIALNSTHYGVGLLNDLHDGAFPRAIGALSRVDTGPRKRYVPVSTASRLAAYEVSPAAAELRGSIENALTFWGNAGCRAGQRSVFLQARGEELACDEYYYGWFPWAVRTAAVRTGNWDSGSEAQEFMDRIAAEVNGACDDGRLTCSPPKDTLRPPMRFAYILEAIGLIPDGLRIIFDSPGGLGTAASIGSNRELVDVARVTHSNIAPPQRLPAEGAMAVRINGWVASGRGEPYVQVSPDVDRTMVTYLSTVADESVLEIAERSSGGDTSMSRGVRFTLETTCLADDCLLIIGHGDGMVSHATINALEHSRIGLLDDVMLGVDEVTAIENPEEISLRSIALPRSRLTVDAQRQIDSLYATLLPWLSLLGLIGLVAASLQPAVRRRDWALIVLALACAVAVLSRIGMFAILEVSAWAGALRIAYLAPAAPFMITFAILGIYLLIEVFVQLVRGRRDSLGATHA